MTNEQWAKRIAVNITRSGFRAQIRPDQRDELDSFILDMINDARVRDRHAKENLELADSIAANSNAQTGGVA